MHVCGATTRWLLFGMGQRSSADTHACCLTPFRRSLQERVQAAGGTVLNNSGLRVMGILQCTRAIGDKDLRQYGVIPTPDVLSIPRTGQEEFLVLATDGLWDVVSNEVRRVDTTDASQQHSCCTHGPHGPGCVGPGSGLHHTLHVGSRQQGCMHACVGVHDTGQCLMLV